MVAVFVSETSLQELVLQSAEAMNGVGALPKAGIAVEQSRARARCAWPLLRPASCPWQLLHVAHLEELQLELPGVEGPAVALAARRGGGCALRAALRAGEALGRGHKGAECNCAAHGDQMCVDQRAAGETQVAGRSHGTGACSGEALP